jgi:WD40-like Beta Propeller Repeat
VALLLVVGRRPEEAGETPIDGGPAVVVREENERLVLPALSADGSTLYFVKPVRSNFRGLGRGTVNEVRRKRVLNTRRPRFSSASPPNASRSKCGQGGPTCTSTCLRMGNGWATSLIDGGTSNLWALPTSGAPMKPLTDFGERSVIIARSVSWAPDSQSIYAAVAEINTDIVLIDGLIP